MNTSEETVPKFTNDPQVKENKSQFKRMKTLRLEH